MHKRFILAALFAIIPAVFAGAEPMRVATFNVEDLSVDEPAKRLARVAEFVHRISADVILLNEVDTPPDDLLAGVRPLLASIAEQHPDAHAYTPIVMPTNTGETSAFDQRLKSSTRSASTPSSSAITITGRGTVNEGTRLITISCLSN